MAGRADRCWSSPAALVAAIEAAVPAISCEGRSRGVRRRAARPGWRLASEKTFTRGDVIIAAARTFTPALSVLDQAVENVLAHGDAVALPVVTGSREQVWTARCVLADEERIATLAESLTGEEGPKIEEQAALDAVVRLEERLSASLSATSTRWQSASS